MVLVFINPNLLWQQTLVQDLIFLSWCCLIQMPISNVVLQCTLYILFYLNINANITIE